MSLSLSFWSMFAPKYYEYRSMCYRTFDVRKCVLIFFFLFLLFFFSLPCLDAQLTSRFYNTCSVEAFGVSNLCLDFSGFQEKQ